MQRFNFRLERLLRLKRQKDSLAELRQSHARRLCDAAQQEVDSLQERLVETALAVEARIGRAIETDCWLAHYQQMAQIRLAVDGAEAKVKRAAAALNEANRARRATATEVEALQHLRERQWRDHRLQSAHAEQVQMDELFGSRHGQSSASTTDSRLTDRKD